MNRADIINSALLTTQRVTVATHNDLVPANIIDDGKRLWLIDWEYGGMGDPTHDLANIVSHWGINQQELLDLYYDGPVSAAVSARVNLWRILSDVREGLWGLVQSRITTQKFVAEWASDGSYTAYGHRFLQRARDALANSVQIDSWLAAVRSDANPHASNPEPLRTTWEEVVGWTFEDAKTLIEQSNPTVRVIRLPEHAMVTMDYVTTRVRVFVNQDGRVVRPPHIG